MRRRTDSDRVRTVPIPYETLAQVHGGGVQVTSWTRSRDGYSYAPVDGLGSKGWTHLSCFRNFQRCADADL